MEALQERRSRRAEVDFLTTAEEAIRVNADGPSTHTSLHHRYLRVQDLQNLRHRIFAPRRPIMGPFAGRHTSPQRGHSVEFTDYREYVPGDDVADIDWKAYGRSDRLYIKRFEHQADMSVHLLVDASASMAYAGLRDDAHAGDAAGGPSKYDQACFLAAAIAFVTLQQQDRVAFARASGGLQDYAPAQGSLRHLASVLDAMDGPQAGRACLADAIDAFAQRATHRGLFVVLSDLLEDPVEIGRALAGLTHRGMDVIVFHVLHPDELRLPAAEEAVFLDSETGERVRVDTEEVREAYERLVQERMSAWARLFRSRGMDSQVVTTDVHYGVALEGYLLGRAAVR